MKLARNEVVPSFIDEIALQLGADVPVCFMGKAVRMQGVGEVLTELAEPPGGAVVLVNPLLQCATASVFRMLGLKNGQQHQSALDLAHPDLWRNDLTDAAIAVVPSIADVLRAMQSVNELNVVRMSGSGATCFGLANDLASATRAARCLRGQYPDWWIVSAALS